MSGLKRATVMSATKQGVGDMRKAKKVGRSKRNGAPIHKPKKIRRV